MYAETKMKAKEMKERLKSEFNAFKEQQDV